MLQALSIHVKTIKTIRHLSIMLSLGIKMSCWYLHYASGRCGGTKVGLCLGHKLALIRPCRRQTLFDLKSSLEALARMGSDTLQSL